KGTRRKCFDLCAGLKVLDRSSSCYDSGNGSGFRSTALTAEKIAVFAPMPSASVSAAINVSLDACPSFAFRSASPGGNFASRFAPFSAYLCDLCVYRRVLNAEGRRDLLNFHHHEREIVVKRHARAPLFHTTRHHI